MLSTKTFVMPSLLNTPTLSSKDRLVASVFCSSGRTITKPNPALLQQTLCSRKVHCSCKIEIIPSIILNLWLSNFYQPLVVIGSSFLATAAYLSSTPVSPPVASGFLSWIAFNRRSILAVSAALTMAPFAYTLIFMFPGIKKLAEVEKKQSFGKEGKRWAPHPLHLPPLLISKLRSAWKCGHRQSHKHMDWAA